MRFLVVHLEIIEVNVIVAFVLIAKIHINIARLLNNNWILKFHQGFAEVSAGQHGHTPALTEEKKNLE
jgi:hypothetical protein